MTAVATLRVLVRRDGDVDGHAAALPWLRLERAADGVFLEIAGDLVERAAALFARSGVALELTAPRARPAALVAAVVTHLHPFGRDDVVDVVSVRAVSVGDATAWAWTAGRGLRRLGAGDRNDRVRALLRVEDRCYRWRRLVFASPGVIASRRLTGARPVFFDRGALDREEDRMGRAWSGSLGEWLRA